MIIIGLGNPGKEYEQTRHNAGRETAQFFAEKKDFPAFEFDKKSNSLISSAKIGKNSVLIALPETFMNKSGLGAIKLIKPKKELKDVVVIHDDLDIPLGCFKISYGKNSGGHKGVESIMRALKTKNFIRIRIGVCPKKKPQQKELLKFIIGKWKPAELEIFKKTKKRVCDALEVMCKESLERAMSEFN